jgi:hypothetical protein
VRAGAATRRCFHRLLTEGAKLTAVAEEVFVRMTKAVFRMLVCGLTPSGATLAIYLSRKLPLKKRMHLIGRMQAIGGCIDGDGGQVRPALYHAGSAAEVRQLVALGADVNIKCSRILNAAEFYTNCPLIFHAVGSQWKHEVVGELLQMDPSLTYARHKGFTLMHVAAVGLKLESVRLLMRLAPDLADAVDGLGRTPLEALTAKLATLIPDYHHRDITQIVCLLADLLLALRLTAFFVFLNLWALLYLIRFTQRRYNERQWPPDGRHKKP